MNFVRKIACLIILLGTGFGSAAIADCAAAIFSASTLASALTFFKCTRITDPV